MTSLTSALFERTEHVVDAEAREELRRRLEHRLSDPALGAACGRLGPRDLVPSPPARSGRFAWTARTASRTIGLRALADVVGSRDLALAPADAVARALVRVQAAGRSGSGTSLEAWAAGWTRGAAAIVAAEATTWCSRLLCALEWDRLGTGIEFEPDSWWRPTRPPSLVLRAKADVLVPAGTAGTEAPHLLVFQSGCPTPASRRSLAFTGLVAALDPRNEHAPGRIVGYWPDCGRWVGVGLDRPTLAGALEAALAVAVSRSPRRRARV